MNALLRKDQPWLWLFLVGGAGGLAGSLLENPYLWTFLVTRGHQEALFHVAWSVGLGLGVAAACFDEVLGTREFLAQRPVAVSTLARSRVLGCVLVLAAWFVLAPALAYAWFAVFAYDFQVDGFDQVPFQWVTMVGAVSACGIGFFAGSLPFAAWARLLWAAVLLVPAFTIVHWLTIEGDHHNLVLFVGLHLLLAVATFQGGCIAMRHRRDVDLPLSASLRVAVLGPCLIAGATAFCIVQMELESVAVHRLQRSYPHPVVVGGSVELVHSDPSERAARVVDAEHCDTNRRVSWQETKGVNFGGNDIGSEFLRIEPPRQSQASRLTRSDNGFLLIDGDGDVFVRLGDGPFRRMGKGPEHTPFVAGSHGGLLLGKQEELLLVFDPDEGTLWRLGVDVGHFVPFELPDGDRFRQIDLFDAREHEPLHGEPLPAKGTRVWVVVGERLVYALRDDRLVAVAKRVPRLTPPPIASTSRVVGSDVLDWVLEVDGIEGVAPFRHEFRPRTAREWFFAGSALLLSMLRPPLVQVPAHMSLPVSRKWEWLADPLVGDGRRSWLVVATLAVAGLCTWWTRRRLRRLGADAPAITFWTIVVLLLGVFGAVAAAVCERPRAYVRRPAIPVPTPRIATAHFAQEIA